MKEPPPDDKKGDASATTPTTSDRVSSLAGNQTSQRNYVLHRTEVKPQVADVDASVSERGTAAVDGLTAAEHVFLEICKAQTGRELPADIKERQNKARALLLNQSYRIADALESQGVKAYGPSKLSLVGVLSGKPTLHIHAHVIVHLEKKLSKERWSELLANVRGWWKHHFSDAQRIHQAREACKYVVKPGDLDQLADSELAELHHQLFRLHLVQCLGAFKEQRKDIEDTKRRLVRVPAPVSSRWELVADWNRGRPAKDLVEAPTKHDSAPDDWLLCTLPPSFALSERAEPLAVVLNYTGQWIAKNRRIIALREGLSPRELK